MKVIEHFHVPAQELDKWIKKHMDEDIRVEYDLNTNTFHMTSVQNVTESEFHMLALNALYNNNQDLSAEEKNAIDYAISSIKTLQDMGVIK